MRIKSVLFDLDGTLIDTAPDMAAALNRILEQESLDPLPIEQIRPHVSRGGLALTKLAFDAHRDADEIEPLRQRFLDDYRQNIARHSRLFEGFEEVLKLFHPHDMPWGVVTNKPGWLTDPLLADLKLAQRAACVVSGDTLEQRKPHPAPLLHACKLIGTTPQQCLYVGDAERDIKAGHNAGMPTLGPVTRCRKWMTSFRVSTG